MNQTATAKIAVTTDQRRPKRSLVTSQLPDKAKKISEIGHDRFASTQSCLSLSVGILNAIKTHRCPTPLRRAATDV
jgi:hypothetical protein